MLCDHINAEWEGEQLVQCTGGYDVVTNACVIAMVSIAVALLMPHVAAVALLMPQVAAVATHKAT
jgi:hypothetical protein